MKVKQQRHISAEAEAALLKALPYSNLTIEDVQEILRGYGWMIWNCGNLCWVLTMANMDGEIEVLLAGGEQAKECLPYWEAAMLAEPAHKGRVIRGDGRKGWARLLKHWERRDDVLYLRVA
jgi:hypothetical protein